MRRIVGNLGSREAARAACRGAFAETSMTRRVLLIAYHYPPEGSSSGVLRTLAFSRHLPTHGWMPHVLTLRGSIYPVRDESLCDEIPAEVTVHRAAAWDTARHLALFGRHFEWMAVPDRYVSWLPFAVRRGLKVVRTVGIDAIFSTSPQPTAHLVAGWLKLRTGLPWIADFRDPWIEEGIHPRPGSLRYRVESGLERFVITRADRVVVTTPEFCADLVARYPSTPAQKFSVIFNGYDDSDCLEVAGNPPGDRFEVLHAGMVTPEYRDPVPLLRAVSTLIRQGVLSPSDIRITFLGAGGYAGTTDFTGVVNKLGLSDVVQAVPRVSHLEAIRRLRHAAVLLLLQASDDTRSLIPAKAFEYLRAGRPILALTAEGATATLLRDTGGGVVVNPRSPDLGDVLTMLFRAWKADRAFTIPTYNIERFSRSMLTGELAKHLNELVSRAGRVMDHGALPMERP
jgi:glycosyltransferase involved in cell wall biosynthesis